MAGPRQKVQGATEVLLGAAFGSPAGPGGEAHLAKKSELMGTGLPAGAEAGADFSIVREP